MTKTKRRIKAIYALVALGRKTRTNAKKFRLALTAVMVIALALAVGLALGAITKPAFADAVKTPTPPTIDGIASPGEWDNSQIEFDTGPRLCEPPNLGEWDLSGAKGRFLWDDTNVYGRVEAYPNTCGPGANPNGPFDAINWEVYVDTND